MHRLLLLVALAMLGGCATPLEVASVTPIRSQTGSRGLDVYEPKRQAGSSVPEFAGDQLVEVRTYKYSEGNGEVEFPGASCSLSASGFSATMRSPAKVRVPLYRGQSSALAVTCEMPGYKKRMVTVAPYDATRSSRLASGSGGGLIGVLVVAAVDAMADNLEERLALSGRARRARAGHRQGQEQAVGRGRRARCRLPQKSPWDLGPSTRCASFQAPVPATRGAGAGRPVAGKDAQIVGTGGGRRG